MKYAVGLETLYWQDAESEEEAIEQVRDAIAEMDREDLNHLDFDVYDSVEEKAEA